MAISEHQEQSPASLLDALYCAEEQWEEEEELNSNIDCKNPSLLPLLLLEQDLFWEDEELRTLFSKEKTQGSFEQTTFDFSLSSIRREKVEWMLMVNARYGFCTLTSVLAVNYFDRFISSFPLQNDKPWMFQLAAVTCVSLAAKVEETHVPLLLDLQVHQPETLLFSPIFPGFCFSCECFMFMIWVFPSELGGGYKIRV